MSSIILVSCVIGIAVGMGATVLFMFPILKKKGVKTEEILQKVDKGLDATDGVLKIAEGILPDNKAIDVLEKIQKYAKMGVNQAEQLCIASTLPADQRNAKAKDTIYAALQLAGIDKTPEVDKVVDGALEAEVLALGHAPVDVKLLQDAKSQLEAQNAQLQTEKGQLQDSNAQLKNENDQLKQTIQTVTTAVQNPGSAANEEAPSMAQATPGA